MSVFHVIRNSTLATECVFTYTAVVLIQRWVQAEGILLKECELCQTDLFHVWICQGGYCNNK